MKRLFSLILVCLLLFACAPRTSDVTYPDHADTAPVAIGFEVQPIQSYDDYVNVLSAALLDGTGNRNFSPISAYFALALAAEGAAGETQAQILDLLGCSDIDTLHGTTDEMLDKLPFEDGANRLTICNSVWTSQTMPVKKQYVKRVTDQYQAKAEAVPFGTEKAGKEIASWIKKNTNGKLAPSPESMEFDPTTLLVLLNTVYFKDAWSKAFRESATAPDMFHAPDGEITVRYMHRLFEGSSIVQGDGWLRYTLPMQHGNRMTFILPDEGVALPELLGSPEQLNALLKGGTSAQADVDVMLPKFMFTDTWELADVLCALGLEQAFTFDADFSGMSDAPMRLDRVLQKSFIEVNEQGAEAAAYTMIDVPTAPAPVELPRFEFHLTRPFLYVIEGRGDTTLFVGTVTAPDAAD